MYDVWAVWLLYDVWDVWGMYGMYGLYGMYGHTLAWYHAWTLYGRMYSGYDLRPEVGVKKSIVCEDVDTS